MEMIQSIQNRIYTIRGSRVMLDFDLAQLYDVPTKALNQAVRRNQARFPDDFMFRLTEEEWQQYSPSTVNNFTEVAAMRSQIVTASQFKRNTAVTPYAFTEQGVAMLSSVLHSGRAIQMNIAIMRAFVEVRRLLLDTSEVFQQLQHLRERIGEHDTQLRAIYDALENLLDDKAAQTKWEKRQRIGFKTVHKS
jgi:hypothetical protein